MEPLSAAEFAALMAPLGPWPGTRRVAVAVSGGADSLCLALLTATWGAPHALIVDHGLRPTSAAEAELTARRLAGLGIPAQILRLSNLPPGPAVAARARAARYEALTQAALAAGCLDLLLGHHRADQAETLLIRRAACSGPAGLAAMAALSHTRDLRLIRPLLAIAPARLRATLREAGLAWVEDPTNQSPTALRARTRATLADADGDGPHIAALATEAAAFAAARAARDRDMAALLAGRFEIYPHGYARLLPGPLPPHCLAALLQAIGGNPYGPDSQAVARLAANPVPAVLAGVRLLEAGRLGPGLLLVREQAAIAPPVAAIPGAIWDRRFRLVPDAAPPEFSQIGALGADAASLRKTARLPSAVLATLPAIRVNGALAAVPHIGYPHPWTCAHMAITFCPALPASGAPFGV